MKKLFLALAILVSSATIAEAQYVYPRVYYQPQIVWYPQGTYLGIGRYYNPYNRYLRLNINYGYYGNPYYYNYGYNTYPYSGQRQIPRYKSNW